LEHIESALDVDGVPGDDCIDDDREAERLLGVTVQDRMLEVAFVGVEDRAAQRVRNGSERGGGSRGFWRL
jgi:hypothetical protein